MLRKLLLLMLFMPAITLADDINKVEWGMFQQNAAHTGYVHVTLDTAAFAANWKTTVNSPSRALLHLQAEPVIENGMLFIQASVDGYFNTLKAISAQNGQMIWSKSPPHDFLNPPAVMNGTVYAESNNWDPANTTLFGYDAKTGRTLFRTPVLAVKQNMPTIYNNHVYVKGGAFNLGLYSLDAIGGDQDWFAPLSNAEGGTAAVNDQYAVAYSSGVLSVFDRTSGSIKASISDPNYGIASMPNDYAPVIINAAQVLNVSLGFLTSYDLTNQRAGWSKGSDFIGVPAFDGQTIYAAKKHELDAFDTSGNLLWKWDAGNEQFVGQMIVTDNLLLISAGGNTYAISKTQHKPVWTYNMGGVLSLAEGHLYIFDGSTLASITVNSVVRN